MSSPASDSNNFYSTTGHILFPILGVVGGLILLIGGYAMWRGPHRQFLPCFNRRKREPLSDDAANQTRRDMRYWGEENALTPMSGPGGGRRGSYFAAQHQQQPYAKRPVRQDSGPRSGSGAAQVQREYRQSQAQYGIPGGPDVGYGYGPGSGAGSGLGHGQHGHGVDLEAGDVVGQAMLGSAMNGGDDYDAYHSAAYGRRRSDRSRSSDGSGSGSAARSRSSTLVTSDTDAYGYALQPKIVEEALESPGGLGTPYDADRDGRSGTGSPAPLLSGSTGDMRSNGSASSNGDYFAVPPPRSNPFGTPTNDPTLLAPAQIGSQGMIRSPGFVPPAHHYAPTPTPPSAAQKQANGPGRALAGGAQGGPPARPRRGSYIPTSLAHGQGQGAGQGQGGAFRPANGAGAGAGASGRPADNSKKVDEADDDLQMM